MFCRYCGKQIPDDSAFCQYCGKQIIVSNIATDLPKANTATDLPKGWEQLTMVIHFRKGEGGWVAQDKYPGPLAQQHFWNEATLMIQEIETMMVDKGWQAIGEHGPACVELESYKSAEGKDFLAETFNAFATYGTSLLFAKNWKFTVKSITLNWRRPTVEEGIVEEEFHMWLNTKTGELERYDYDSSKNLWILMDLDENGNWIRKSQPSINQEPSKHEVLLNDHPESDLPPGDHTPGDHTSSPPLNLPLKITNEEERILKLLAEGLSNPEIAKRLNESPVHTSLITDDLLDKFMAETKSELLEMAKEKGFISAD